MEEIELYDVSFYTKSNELLDGLDQTFDSLEVATEYLNNVNYDEIDYGIIRDNDNEIVGERN